MCRGPDGTAHLWNSSIGVRSLSVVCDWCVLCSTPREGFISPDDRRFATGDAEIPEEKTLQGLSAGVDATGHVSGAALPYPPLSIHEGVEGESAPDVGH